MWEYNGFYVTTHTLALEKLAALGRDGWELVNFERGFYVLKRPLVEAEPKKPEVEEPELPRLTPPRRKATRKKAAK